MLAQRVEAHLLERADVELHRSLRRRREKSVRPPALIERAHHVVRLPVQEEAPDAVLVAPLLQRAHREVPLDGVRPVAHAETIQRRRLRAPAGEPFRHLHHDVAAGKSLPLHGVYRVAILQHLDLHERRARTRHVDLERHRPCVDVRRHAVRYHVVLRHLLRPDAPEYSRAAVVEARRRIEDLLSGGAERAGLGRIPHKHRQLVRAFLRLVSDVDDPRHVHGLVRHVELVVPEERLRAEVDGVEVEKRPHARLLRDVDRAPVPQELVGRQVAPHARELGLDGERHGDLALPRRRPHERVRDRRNRVVPLAVQASPVRAHHLRTGIEVPRDLGLRSHCHQCRASGAHQTKTIVFHCPLCLKSFR